MSKITTIWTYQLNNVQTEFAVNFDYLSRKFVQVTLIGKDRKVLRMNVDYRFIGPKTIKTNKAWGSADGYQYLEIRRVTSATDSIVDFSDGSILRAGDLTIANLQSMHIAEEARNLAGDALGVNDDGQLDARARRIVNLGNPVGRLDAVNKAYIDDAAGSVIDSKNKALQYRNEAQGFRNEAEQFKNTASSKASEISSKIAKADSLNTEANSNSSKALEAVAGAQRSAQEAASSATKAKASEKNAKTSEDKAREFASSIQPDTLVKKSMITQTTGNDVSLVVSQDLMTKEVNKLMPKTGGTFTGKVTVNNPSNDIAMEIQTNYKSGDIIGLNTRPDSTHGPTIVNRSTKPIRIYQNTGSIFLPTKSGTLALTSDIKKPVWREPSGLTGLGTLKVTFNLPLHSTSTNNYQMIRIRTDLDMVTTCSVVDVGDEFIIYYRDNATWYLKRIDSTKMQLRKTGSTVIRTLHILDF